MYFETPFTITPFVAISGISDLSAAYWNYTVDFVTTTKFRTSMIGDQAATNRNFVYIAIGK